ncbi:MAG: hypothetical protein V4730_11790 [Pseudomonadota bacterium]
MAKPNKELMDKAKALFSAALRTHGVPHDEAGLTLTAIRETETGRILSLHVTPIDLVDGKPVPRFNSTQEVSCH